jgi:hypothetical protein
MVMVVEERNEKRPSTEQKLPPYGPIFVCAHFSPIQPVQCREGGGIFSFFSTSYRLNRMPLHKKSQ